MKKIFFLLTFFTTTCLFSQELIYKSGGRIFSSEGQKMKPSEVRELLKTQPGMLEFYNDGRSKKTLGNILFYGSFALFAADYLTISGAEDTYPKAMTYVGIGTFLLSFPIKMGYTKKIKMVVQDYNKEINNKDNGLTIESIQFVTNQNGVGLQITF
ncbi:hypothetical protein [Flavobacterium lacisediminis]|uniref:Lipoprotein n=1 Tax=Flavobacterium lacisediminis TaxID=2989705 RepID=A0ABT3EI25_9FLAO|nr:hypothetical protein [Flavobacterium lacisediminis]MCW1148225.1 hypothetical protein [Flavobacterium lacisediminis]